MRGRMGRVVAISAAVVATAAVYIFVVRDDSEEATTAATATTAAVPTEVQDLVAGLTTEQKVDAVMLVGFEGTDGSAPFLQTLGERPPGGVVLRSANWLDAAQGSALVEAIRAAAADGDGPPPLVAAPQEGSEHRALADLPPEQRAIDIGDFGDPVLAQEWARKAGEALSDAGVDLNLGLVGDVATIDSPLGDRAFSDDPSVTAQLTAAAVAGCEEAGIACAVRHFPGLGAGSDSTDAGPATVSLDTATLATRDLLPFEAAITEGVPAVVLSHAFYAAYDPVTPGSLSPEVATGLLRERLGFKGVAITDDLATGAIRATGGVRQSGVEALAAGADMLLVESPAEAEGVRAGLLAAAESGEISPDRLDQAVGRVLELKRSLGVLQDEAIAPPE